MDNYKEVNNQSGPSEVFFTPGNGTASPEENGSGNSFDVANLAPSARDIDPRRLGDAALDNSQEQKERQRNPNDPETNLPLVDEVLIDPVSGQPISNVSNYYDPIRIENNTLSSGAMRAISEEKSNFNNNKESGSFYDSIRNLNSKILEDSFSRESFRKEQH